MALLGGQALAKDGARKTLPGHVPEAIWRLTPKGTLATNRQVSLVLGLPLKDAAGLDDFLKRAYDPKDPTYGQYLTPNQFAERFGPTQAQYDQVVAFAQRHHLKITGRQQNRLVLDVNGSVAEVQRAFNVTLWSFKHPTEDRNFYAPDIEPSVDIDLPVADVMGLNNYILPHPKSVQMTSTTANATTRSGSGPGGTYRGKPSVWFSSTDFMRPI